MYTSSSITPLRKAVYRDLKKKFDKNLLEKDDEISCLKDHSKKLLAQIKKSKDKKQCN
jgi:hypothetical protein